MRGGCCRSARVSQRPRASAILCPRRSGTPSAISGSEATGLWSVRDIIILPGTQRRITSVNTGDDAIKQRLAPLSSPVRNSLRLMIVMVAAEARFSLRTVLLICAVAALPLHAIVANAQLICGMGQSVCGAVCYEPTLGQHCDGGIVCGPGQSACGRSCYTPTMGQRCDAGVVCGPGQMVCAGRCFSPSAGQHCDQGVVCGPGQFACGRGCYSTSAGQQCNLATGSSPRKDHDRNPGNQPHPGKRHR